MCRWMSPESLRLYRRLGTREMVQWADQAEAADPDTMQLGSLPLIDAAEGFSALVQHSELLDTDESEKGAAEAQAPGAPGDSSLATATCESSPAPDLSPLSTTNAVGRRVLVPRALWPSDACDEHRGEGWTATIRACSRGVARVAFLHARDEHGSRYSDVHLQLTSLRPA